MKRRIQRAKYVVGDVCATLIAWSLFSVFRFYRLGGKTEFYSLSAFFSNSAVQWGTCAVLCIMISLFWISGYYNQPYFKSRLKELFNTLITTFVASIIFFFAILLDDLVRFNYFAIKVIAIQWGILFIVIYIFRFITTQWATTLIHNRKMGFRTLIIGSGEHALLLSKELNSMYNSLGFMISGFIVASDHERTVVPEEQILGNIRDVKQIVADYGIEELIVALDVQKEQSIHSVVNQLYELGLPIRLRLDDIEIITSRVRMDTIYASPMIDLTTGNLSECEKNIKRILDVVISVMALIIVFPILLVSAIAIKKDTRGDVFYSQMRVGYRKKLFKMYKLRSMVANAEPFGPALANEKDVRITKVGRILRKYRIDELPQFWNVLKGDMSLVGHRPEREYFVNHIIQQAPYYSLLYQMRPGITSWGMVKYGYARTIDEMIGRLRYDIIYVENASLMIDFKIIIYTVRTVITGKGI